jgi:hypothetical protein
VIVLFGSSALGSSSSVAPDDRHRHALGATVRAAAALPTTSRDASGFINWGPIETAVENRSSTTPVRR